MVNEKVVYSYSAILIALILFPIGWRVIIQFFYGQRIIKEGGDIQRQPVAIVFGAAVFGSGRLSTVLRDRMDTAIHLYETGKVNKILVSGSKTTSGYNEPEAMMAYAIQHGVQPKDLELDFAGQRTYDTCYRAKHVFDIEQAFLVSQTFHLPRAIFICDRLGIKAYGISADKRTYRGARWYSFRETVATFVALADVIRQAAPKVQETGPFIELRS